jgi:hypothetical protein
MEHAHKPHPVNYDPHGYQPLVVDEDCLTDEDCREAILDSVSHPRDWHSCLRRDEQIALQNELNNVEKFKSSYLYQTGEMPEKMEIRAVAARLGRFRAYARDKYAGGRQVWYGDSVPFGKG